MPVVEMFCNPRCLFFGLLAATLVIGTVAKTPNQASTSCRENGISWIAFVVLLPFLVGGSVLTVCGFGYGRYLRHQLKVVTKELVDTSKVISKTSVLNGTTKPAEEDIYNRLTREELAIAKTSAANGSDAHAQSDGLYNTLAQTKGTQEENPATHSTSGCKYTQVDFSEREKPKDDGNSDQVIAATSSTTLLNEGEPRNK